MNRLHGKRFRSMRNFKLRLPSVCVVSGSLCCLKCYQPSSMALGREAFKIHLFDFDLLIFILIFIATTIIWVYFFRWTLFRWYRSSFSKLLLSFVIVWSLGVWLDTSFAFHRQSLLKFLLEPLYIPLVRLLAHLIGKARNIAWSHGWIEMYSHIGLARPFSSIRIRIRSLSVYGSAPLSVYGSASSLRVI